MKRFSVMLLLLLSLFLVSCDKTEEDEDVVKEITIETLGSALAVFDENNYQMDIAGSFYDQLETEVTIKFDGSKSLIIIDEYNEEYYVRDGRTLTSYVKDGDIYIKEELRSPKDEKFMIFNTMKKEMFDLKDKRFVMKEENYDVFLRTLEFDETQFIKSVTITLDDNDNIGLLSLIIEDDRDSYLWTFKLSKYGEVSIALPEVN